MLCVCNYVSRFRRKQIRSELLSFSPLTSLLFTGNDDLKEQVVLISRASNILSRYTSLVGVDSQTKVKVIEAMSGYGVGVKALRRVSLNLRFRCIEYLCTGNLFATLCAF